MNTTINERIQKLIEEYHLNPNSLATRLGVAGTVIYNIIGERKSKPSFDLFQKIFQTFEDLNPHWLLTGEGPMRGRSTSPNTGGISTPTEKVFPIVVDNENTEQVSLVPIYAQAGYMRGFEDPDFIKTLPISDMSPYENGTYRDFEIKGDSMESYFFEKDIVRAKYLPEIYWNQRLHLGELFVIVHATEGVVFKQIIEHNLESGDLKLHSFNSYYNDYVVNVKDIRQLWYYSEYRSSRKFNYIR